MREFIPLETEHAKQIHELEFLIRGTNEGTLEDLETWLSQERNYAYGCLVKSKLIPKRRRLCAFCLFKNVKEQLRITALAVHPQFRRQGVGSTMLLAIERIAWESDCIPEIRVGDANLTGQLFLRHVGWKCNKILKHYFGNDQHAYSFSNESQPFDVLDGIRREKQEL